MLRPPRSATLGVALLTLLGSAPALAADSPAPAPSPARAWLIAPSATGPWTLRVDNVSEDPIRLAADARLLTFTIDTHAKNKRPTKCELPASMRPKAFPEDRALLLAPGTSYVQSFDPRLFCFGKLAEALKGSAVVRVDLGWPAPKYTKKPSPPYAVESARNPAAAAPLPSIHAPTFVLSYAKSNDEDASATSATPAASATPPPAAEEPQDEGRARRPLVDENAARIELSGAPYVDARSARGVSIAMTLKNTGNHPATLVARARNVAFHMVGPDGSQQDCAATPPTNAVPRDMFRTLGPGQSTSLSVLLSEQCPGLDLSRPGLYQVEPTLEAEETGQNVGVHAWTGNVLAKAPTLVRIQTGSAPFYDAPPRARRTPSEDRRGRDHRGGGGADEAPPDAATPE